MARHTAILIGSLLFTVAVPIHSLSQMQITVGATSKWVFGIDDKLTVRWGTPNEGYEIACTSGEYFVAMNSRSVPPKMYCAFVSDGKRAWTSYLAGVPESVAVSPDTGGTFDLRMSLVIKDSVRTEVRDLASGNLIEAATVLKNGSSIAAPVSPPPAPDDTLWFISTPKYVCALTRDLSVVWHQERKKDEHLAVSKPYCILSDESGLRVLDQKSGSEVWERRFSRKVTATGAAGSFLVVTFSDGQHDTLDISTGGAMAPGR